MLDLIQKMAAKDNQTFNDLYTFMKTADVAFIDAHGNKVDIQRVVVTWGD